MVLAIQAYSLAKDGNKKVSANFSVREFRCKDGSDPIFIDSELVDILQKIRDRFLLPVNINSAYRTPVHNENEGGAKYSQHLYGKAADIRIDGVAPNTIYEYADSLMPNHGGVIRYSTFVHVDVRSSKWREIKG